MTRDQALSAGYSWEIEVSHVPEGVKSEHYIATGIRYYKSAWIAEDVCNDSRLHKSQNPDQYDPEMTFTVKEL